MTVAIELNTPLADALTTAIQPQLEQHGWASGGPDDAALAEYIIMMVTNNKSQDEVARELSADLLGLESDDPGVHDFCNWLFATIAQMSAQFNVPVAQGDVATGGAQGDVAVADRDQDMDMTPTESSTELNAYVATNRPPTTAGTTILTSSRPTGPKAMRNGDTRGRGKRIMGQINRAMDRTHESALHRVRGGGNERISRTPPTGPRMGAGRQPRGAINNNRAASIQHGLANMNGMPAPGMHGAMGAGLGNMNGGMGAMNAWGPMMPGQQQTPDVMSVLQQQQAVLDMMQQQLLNQTGNNGRFNGQGRGRPLSERTQRGNFRGGRGGHHYQNGHNAHQSNTTRSDSAPPQGEDADMGDGKGEATNPEEIVCRYNLKCTNRECKWAHQSPAAPPGVTMDLKDVCSFGAACKNFKCVGRHPSPATKAAHQSEQDCKFWPNCQNARCPFRHPSKPPCRNGGDCKTPGCDFYHSTVMCKFNPCTNRYCTFKHEDGQRGAFADKVWTADGASSNTHVSERKFADEKATEEQVLPGDDAMEGTETDVVG